MLIRDVFTQISQSVSRKVGSPIATAIAVAVTLLWAVTGPYFHYSDAWQLALNTGTSIVTFIMVFLIQSTQNRETIAMQMKLDELIRVSEDARNKLVQAEALTDTEMDDIKESLVLVAKQGGTGRVELEEAKASLREAEQDIHDARKEIEAAEVSVAASGTRHGRSSS